MSRVLPRSLLRGLVVWLLKSVCIWTLVCLCGCATILRTGSQHVRIESEPTGALVTIDQFTKTTTPAGVKLKRNQAHYVHLEKPGYSSKDETLRPALNGGVFAYSWFGFVLVDFLTGALYDLKPDKLYVRLDKVSGSQLGREETSRQPATQPVQTAQPPALSFEYSLTDDDGDKVLSGGESVTLEVRVWNRGKGMAQNVRAELSGTSRALGYLAAEQALGDVEPDGEALAKFETALPTQIDADDGTILIRVTESRGYNALEERELQVAMQPAKVKRETDVISRLVDVDAPLQASDFKREDAYAVVVGISGYRSQSLPKVTYAKKDAEAVKDYLVGVCGFKEANIRLLVDDGASLSDLTAYCEEWLARNVRKGSFVFVYFAGHGTPSPDKGEAYIVPYDGEPGFVSKLYPL